MQTGARPVNPSPCGLAGPPALRHKSAMAELDAAKARLEAAVDRLEGALQRLKQRPDMAQAVERLTHERAELAAENERLRAELAALLQVTEAVSGRIDRVMAELQDALEE